MHKPLPTHTVVSHKWTAKDPQMSRSDGHGIVVLVGRPLGDPLGAGTFLGARTRGSLENGGSVIGAGCWCYSGDLDLVVIVPAARRRELVRLNN